METEIPRLISDTAWRSIRKAFGVRGVPFFDFYYTLYAFTHDLPVEGDVDLLDTFRANSRVIYTLLALEDTKNSFTDMLNEFRPLLTRIAAGQDDNNLIRRAVGLYGDMISLVARDRDVYLKPRRLDTLDWRFFRVMTEKEEKLERLRLSNPDMYENIQQGRERIRELDRNIVKEIRSDGLQPSQTKILDRIVNIGTDPKTGERLVFDPDGDILGVDDYIAKRKAYLRAQKKLERVFPQNIDAMREVSDEEIEILATGDVEYVALTDDKAKQNAITRVYPTRKIDGKPVITDGRFKGFYLDSVVNAAGRMIEGVAYDYDPKVGRPSMLEVKNADGTINVKVTREPYVTVDSNGDLLLRLPSTHAFSALRKQIAAVAKNVPSISYHKESRNSAFTFPPKDFAVLREALGGMALSQAAMEKIAKHFKDLAVHELATGDENLKNYTTDRIGGFRPGVQLFRKQRQAMAWLDSRGMSGVLAMGAGTGKTVTSIAAMQKMVRDGFADDPEKGNGRFLFVCPTALVGNLPKEIYAMVENPTELLDRVDVMSYTQFGKALKADANFAKNYVAIFFDEAQALKNPGSATAKDVLRLKHPRKVALTASPMERSPMEVFVLTAITNNIDLNTPQGKALMLAFRKRFCEEVGGRIVGMKNDPVTGRDLRVWVKQNLFYVDKQDVEEAALPRLKRETTALTMDPQVETAYRSVADKIQKILTGMVAKYRDRDTSATDPAIETARVKLRKQFTLLTDLSLMPDLIIPGATNPKLEQASRLLDERVETSARTIFFTDSPKMASHTALTLSKRFPGKLLALGLANAIELWQSGKKVASYGKKAYTADDGTKYKADAWKTFILDRVVKPNPAIFAAILTSTYAVGQNLQTFNTVVHLDRDSWNSETMTQRTARAWRTGQRETVDEVTLDVVYSDTRHKRDGTLDQIRAAMQQMEADLFDQVVIASQVEALGKEFFEMRRMDSSFYELNRKMMTAALSPYLARLGEENM